MSNTEKEINGVLDKEIQEKVLSLIDKNNEIIKLFQPIVDSINGICTTIDVSVYINEDDYIIITDPNRLTVPDYIITTDITQYTKLLELTPVINKVMVDLFKDDKFLHWLKHLVLEARKTISEEGNGSVRHRYLKQFQDY